MAPPNHQQESTDVILARLDERTKRIAEEMDSIKASMESSFVTHDQFAPVKMLVYGCVGMILTAFVGAIITLIIRGGQP